MTKMLDTYIFASHVFDGPPFVMPSLVQNFLIVTDITNMLVKIVAMNRKPENIKYVWPLAGQVKIKPYVGKAQIFHFFKA